MALPTDSGAVRLKSPRFLVVRRDNIGDLVCTTPLIAALRARHPGAWIGALVNTYNSEVLARNPSLDAVYAYEKLKHRTGGWLPTILRTLRLTQKLRAEQIDCVLVPSATPQALRMAARLRPRQIISDLPQDLEGQHEVERTFTVGKELGVEGEPGPMRIYPDPGLRTRMLGLLGSGFVGSGPTVAIHVSARRPAQRWPIERYAALIDALRAEVRVVLLWAPGASSDPRHPGDDEVAERIPAGETVIKVPTPDLATLIAALSAVDWVICPDGGAMHLAAALGKPVVALFGDSPVERWRPWGVEHRIVRPDSRNLADLPLAGVLEAYRALVEVGIGAKRRG